MVMMKDMTELTRKDLWQEVKEEADWWGEIKGQTLGVVKRLVLCAYGITLSGKQELMSFRQDLTLPCC